MTATTATDAELRLAERFEELQQRCSRCDDIPGHFHHLEGCAGRGWVPALTLELLLEAMASAGFYMTVGRGLRTWRATVTVSYASEEGDTPLAAAIAAADKALDDAG